MRIHHASIALCCLCLLTFASFANDRPKGDAWTPLFDGKTLSGWTTASGKPVEPGKGWSVEDGMLVRSGHGGDIYTADEYADFELKLEWKLSPGVNSGIKYRVTKYEPGGLLGPEYQLIDEATTGRDGDLGSTASLYVLKAPEGKKINPPGQWNETRIIARGTKLEHHLNGVKVVEIDTASDEFKQRVAKSKFAKVEGFARNKSGRIMLQDHASGSRETRDKDVIWFRNIQIRRLGD